MDFYNTLVKSAEKLELNKEPEFKVMSGVMRKYIELNMKNIWNKQPIKEVILGPNCKANIDEFNEFLESCDVGCNAKSSEMKIRK